MNDIEIFVRLSLAGLSILITLISLVSFVKVRGGKIALASTGFFFFAVLGVLLCLGIFFPAVEAFVSVELTAGIALFALIFFYLSILKR